MTDHKGSTVGDWYYMCAVCCVRDIEQVLFFLLGVVVLVLIEIITITILSLGHTYSSWYLSLGCVAKVQVK